MEALPPIQPSQPSENLPPASPAGQLLANKIAPLVAMQNGLLSLLAELKEGKSGGGTPGVSAK